MIFPLLGYYVIVPGAYTLRRFLAEIAEVNGTTRNSVVTIVSVAIFFILKCGFEIFLGIFVNNSICRLIYLCIYSEKIYLH